MSTAHHGFNLNDRVRVLLPAHDAVGRISWTGVLINSTLEHAYIRSSHTWEVRRVKWDHVEKILCDQ